MRRVALISETFLPKVDGIVTTLCRVLDELPRLGWEATVVAPGPGPDRYGVASVLRVPAAPLLLYPEVRLGWFTPRTAQLLDRQRPDVVHLAGPAFLGVAGLVYARQRRLPVVSSYHTQLAPYARIYGLNALEQTAWGLLRLVHDRTAVTLAPSTAVVRELQARGLRNVILWSRGVDAGLFHPSRRSAAGRARLGVRHEDEVVVAYVGRLAREKGLDRASQALQADPAVRLALIGDGPYRTHLAAILPPERVTFTGYLHGVELAEAYASADIFLFPSTTETFGNVLLEAMASGLPVVTMATAGGPDVIVSGVHGYLVDPGDATAICDRVARLVADPAARSAMGAAARRAAETRSWSRIAAELAGHYDEALARAGEGRPRHSYTGG